MQEFAKKYKMAGSERARLDVCIDAINQGLVCRDGPVGNIDQIFGTTYSKKIPRKKGSMETGVVRFADIPVASQSEEFARGYSGWYLAFDFDYQGVIQNYYLSNVHK